MATTLVNGDAHDWVGLNISFLGGTPKGVSAINYDLDRAKTNNKGIGTKPVSRGRGSKDYSGSITLSEAELNGIERGLPPGKDITDIKSFNIVISMRRGTVFTVHKLIACEFLNRGVDMNTETTNVEKQISLIIGDIIF